MSLSALRHFIIPESVTFIDMMIFDGSPLEFLSIPSSVVEINQSSSSQHNSLMRITFSKDSRLKIIGNMSYRRTMITLISIPSSVEAIEDSAFQRSEASRINFPVDCRLKELEYNVFVKCFIIQIDIPLSVRVVKSIAFEYYYVLEVFQFKKDSEIRYILQEAFFSCLSLRSINLENCKHLETIELKAFDKEVFKSLGNGEGRHLEYDHDVRYVKIG